VRRRITGVTTWVTLALVVALGIEIALAATAPAAKSVVEPSQVLQDSLVAAGASASFHYRATWHTNGLTQTIVGDVGLSSGTRSVSVGGTQFSAVLVDRVVYFRGNAAALRDQLGLPAISASSDTEKWISLQQSDGPYQSIEEGLTTGTALSQVLIVPRAVSADHRGPGAGAVRITGRIPPGTRNQVVTGSARLDVAAHSKLPSTYVAHGRNGGQPWSASITFTRWGEIVPMSAPTGALSFGSVPVAASQGS
jgi:hypothetical protein